MYYNNVIEYLRGKVTTVISFLEEITVISFVEETTIILFVGETIIIHLLVYEERPFVTSHTHTQGIEWNSRNVDYILSFFFKKVPFLI